ncbi:FecR family protein [Natronogracilivirga saccharolytica]|uniref:FecR domain-containing protein n=1 Tax=Natronogracilivirga saccharolytica TaxID=2812953 RepID=A0A8J7RMN7_9BACT|nr:FecR domain-containing protein [Natronogracilivirga saccharolytica]MBP3192544.1 FecR domain-containing protein [Natronogracilivirga saccharolytica]
MSRKKPDTSIFEKFRDADREHVARIWEVSGRNRPERVTRPGNASEYPDAEREWRRLQKRIRSDASLKKTGAVGRAGRPDKKRPTGTLVSLYSAVAAVAALLLAGFFYWYLFVPVTVEAPRGSFTSWQWEEGVQVELNSGSSISWYRRPWNGHRELNLHGEAYFEVQPDEKSFTVTTHNASIAVTGTRFNVRAWDSGPQMRTELTLIDGEVSLASLMQPAEAVQLEPGHSSVVDSEADAPHKPEPADTSRALAWRDKGFYFSGLSLSEVAGELERRYNTEIEIEDEALSERRLTLYLPSPDDLESIVTSICHVTDCRYSWSDDGIRLY